MDHDARRGVHMTSELFIFPPDEDSFDDPTEEDAEVEEKEEEDEKEKEEEDGGDGEDLL